MESVGDVLQRNKGLGPGFDFLRISLAVSIVCFHAQLLTGNDWVRSTPLWFLEFGLVPMFFALSGFLVTASATRLSLRNFLINRALRIVPALAVDIFVCALLIGPILTTFALGDYFTDPRFRSYFLNIFGYIHYQLPGVFETHINTRVNGALWTVPYEIICYVITSFFIVTKFLRASWKVVAFAAAMVLVGMVFELSPLLSHLPSLLRRAIHFAFISRDAQIVTAFLCGVIAYQFRERIPYSPKLLVLAVAICLATSLAFDSSFIERVAPRIILLPALTYIVVFIGLTPIGIPGYFRKGDYSYGVYLYHDPLLQVVITIFPAISMAPIYGGIFTFIVGLPLVILLATLSWHFVEKPILKLRKRFSFVARARGIEQSAETQTSRPGNSSPPIELAVRQLDR